ncbi:MAG: DUF3999 family protein [Fulvivirga sp.]
MRNRILVIICLLLVTIGGAKAQFGDYSYKRSINGITDQWHSLDLPDNIYEKVSPKLVDIRIIEVNGVDTLEVPYIVKKANRRREEVNFDVINQTTSVDGFYYTFKVDPNASIDKISIDLGQENFDFKVALEGSQDQKEWFTILEDYRIVSIKNSLTDYQFTTLKFLKSQFGYYRLFIPAKENPDFRSAGLSRTLVQQEKYRDYVPVNMSVTNDRKTKETVITANFELPVPMSTIAVEVADSLDYYRSVTIQFLKDSFNTEKGWQHKYQTLYRGTLSSLENNAFHFPPTVADQLKIIIDNNDNRPLTLPGVKAVGKVSVLIARFASPGNYYLLYGNKNVRKPDYDIKNFKSSIPGDLKSVELGAEQIISQSQPGTQPLFESQWWFWLVIVAVMLVLVLFSLRMVKGK